jgi:hypothetical protein
MAAPGLPEAFRGKTAYELLGRHVILDLLMEHCPDLAGLDDPFPDFESRYVLRDHPVAEKIITEWATRFYYFLYILKKGEAANRAARVNWDDSYWEYWGSIDRVILGGGLLAGVAGQRLLVKLKAMLGETLCVEIAPYPALLPSMGAARAGNLGFRCGLVFDFGQTSAKRSLAIYNEDNLVALHRFPAIATNVPRDSLSLFKLMEAVLLDSWSLVKFESGLSPCINASIANYVEKGSLTKDFNYGVLLEQSPDPAASLAALVSEVIGQKISLNFMHDGTAAAYAFAGTPKTAVITTGTALGIGFPPPSEGLYRLNLGDFRMLVSNPATNP